MPKLDRTGTSAKGTKVEVTLNFTVSEVTEYGLNLNLSIGKFRKVLQGTKNGPDHWYGPGPVKSWRIRQSTTYYTYGAGAGAGAGATASILSVFA